MRAGKNLVRVVLPVLLLTVVESGGVAHAAAPPPAQDTTTFCQNVPEANPFTDVGSGPHHDNILCLAFAGITQGATATTYNPSAIVRRDQMATFIARSIDEMNRLQTPGTTLQDLPLDEDNDDFWDDVDDSNVHKKNIGRLYEANIVNGTDVRTYNPSGAVTRAQMASFINRSEKYLTGTAFTSSSDFFTDDDGSPHEDNINGIASVGIASGKAPGTYGPNDPVTREQMASFLVRWFAVHEAAGDITPLPPSSGPDLLSVTGSDLDQDFRFSKGDPIVLTFANAVSAASSITLTDGFSTVVTLTDDSPTPSGATDASFVLSNGGTTLTITPKQDVVFNGAGQFNGPVVLTDASGIADDATNESWNPDKEPIDQVRFEIA